MFTAIALYLTVMNSSQNRLFALLAIILIATFSPVQGRELDSNIGRLQTDATAGDAEAQFELGSLYDKGETVHQDFSEAAKWYLRAAEQGHPKAQNNLGYMYLEGQGVPQNSSEAVKWLRLAAVQGLANAQASLGLMYLNGEWVSEDYAEAAKWLRLAADQGQEDATNALDWMRATGTLLTPAALESESCVRLVKEYVYLLSELNNANKQSAASSFYSSSTIGAVSQEGRQRQIGDQEKVAEIDSETRGVKRQLIQNGCVE